MPSFFELQIKTMFQYAWAESEHDLNHKTEKELLSVDKRLIAYSAAQAWGQALNRFAIEFGKERVPFL